MGRGQGRRLHGRGQHAQAGPRRGELHCVGATTLDEYRKYIEKDAALERRFQKVLVDEPSVEDTIAILRGLQERYEVHHKVEITDPAIGRRATLSHRYIADRQLPDKAIDLIDEAAARIRMEIDSKPEALDKLERRIIQLKIEQEALKKEKDEASRKRWRHSGDAGEPGEGICRSRGSLEGREGGAAGHGADSRGARIARAWSSRRAPRRQSRAHGELQYGKIPELEKRLSAAAAAEDQAPTLVRNKVTERRSRKLCPSGPHSGVQDARG